MDLYHNIWLILLLSLPSQDIILGPEMQFCWCQPRHGAYPHLVTEPFSQLWNSLPTEIRNIQTLTSFKGALKTNFFKRAFLIDLFIHIAFNWLIDFILIIRYAHVKIFVLHMRNISFIFIIIIMNMNHRPQNWPPHRDTYILYKRQKSNICVKTKTYEYICITNSHFFQ